MQFGNRTDVARQSAIVIDARDGGSIQVLAKIDSFDLTDKNYIGIGVYPVTGRAYQYVYGDMFCGDRNLDDPEATYITFQQAPGDTKPRMRMNTDVIIGKNSSGLKNLSEWPEVKQDIAEFEAELDAGTLVVVPHEEVMREMRELIASL